MFAEFGGWWVFACPGAGSESSGVRALEAFLSKRASSKKWGVGRPKHRNDWLCHAQKATEMKVPNAVEEPAGDVLNTL